MIAARRDAPFVAAQFGEAVHLLQILVENPGAVGERALDSDQQVPGADSRGAGGEGAVIAIFADRGLDEGAG